MMKKLALLLLAGIVSASGMASGADLLVRGVTDPLVLTALKSKALGSVMDFLAVDGDVAARINESGGDAQFNLFANSNVNTLRLQAFGGGNSTIANIVGGGTFSLQANESNTVTGEGFKILNATEMDAADSLLFQILNGTTNAGPVLKLEGKGSGNVSFIYDPAGADADRFTLASNGFFYRPSNPTHNAVTISDTGGSGKITIAGGSKNFTLQSQTAFDGANVNSITTPNADQGLLLGVNRGAGLGPAVIINNSQIVNGVGPTDDLLRLISADDRVGSGNTWSVRGDGSTLIGAADVATVIDVMTESGRLSLIAAFFDGASEDFTDADIVHVVTESTGAQAAVGVLTLTGFPLNTETTVIDVKTYTWQTVLTDVDGNVLIGASASASLDNLIAAINLGAGSGTLYAASTTLHPTVSASAGAGDTMDAQAKTPGTAGNSIATTETLTNGSWGGATLSGGLAAGSLASKLSFKFDDVEFAFIDQTGLASFNGGVTIGDVGDNIADSPRTSTGSVDIAEVAAQTCLDTSFTNTGAVVGAECVLGLPASPTANLSYICYISSADTTQIRACNPTGSAINPAAATYSVRTFNP